MCLAIPGKIVAMPEQELSFALVAVGGVRRKVILDMLPEPAHLGNWVLVHVGFAMNIVSEKEAEEQLELLRALGEFLDEPLDEPLEEPREEEVATAGGV